MARPIDERTWPKPTQVSILARPKRSSKAGTGVSLYANLIGLLAGQKRRPRVLLPLTQPPADAAEAVHFELQAFNEPDAGEPSLDGVELSANESVEGGGAPELSFASDSDIDLIGEERVHRSPAVGIPEPLEPVAPFEPPTAATRARPLPQLRNVWSPTEPTRLWDSSPAAVARQFSETAHTYWNGHDQDVISWNRMEPISRPTTVESKSRLLERSV